MINKGNRIWQFSDMHLLADDHAKFLGLNVDQTFKAVVKHAQEHDAFKLPDLVLLTGDLSQDYSLASYERIADTFQDFSCPVVALLGNHDDERVFKRVLSGTNVAIDDQDLVVGEWRILLLNSRWSGQVAGRLSEQELLFLETALSQQRTKSTLIFLHHHVLPVGLSWIDSVILTNATEFLAIIDRCQQIKAVFSGHVHQESNLIRNNVSFLTTPSTSWQFAQNASGFRLDTAMPGYRWIDVDAGDWCSEVKRIPFNEKFVPDLNSKGY